MLIAWIPEVKVAYVVDFASNNWVGYRDLSGASLPEYWESIDTLLEWPIEHIVFAHGRPGDKSTLKAQAGYWKDLRKAVHSAIEKGLTEDEAANQVRLDNYSSWAGYKDYIALNVRAIYRYVKKKYSNGK